MLVRQLGERGGVKVDVIEAREERISCADELDNERCGSKCSGLRRQSEDWHFLYSDGHPKV